MTTIALVIILVVCGGAAYFFPQIAKFAYFIMAVCAFVWLLTVLGVLPAQVRIP